MQIAFSGIVRFAAAHHCQHTRIPTKDPLPMHSTASPSSTRRRWCQSLLALSAWGFGLSMPTTAAATGFDPLFKKSVNDPARYFDGSMLEMAKAIRANDMAKVRRLAPGQNLAQTGREDMTLMWFAMQPGHVNPEAVKTLVSLGVDPATQVIKNFGSALDFVFMSRTKANDTTGLDLLRAMLDGGMSPQRVTDASNTTLLHSAAGPGSGSLEIVKLLLQRGTDINALDRLGRSALHDAINTNHIALALYLVQQGSRVDTRTINGVSVTWSVWNALGKMQAGPVKAQYEQLRDLMIAKGVQWPPDPPDVVRDQMRARGEKVVVPAGNKR